MMPYFFSVSENVVFTETESMTASTATPASTFCSSRLMPNLLNVSTNSGSTSSIEASCFFFLGMAKYLMSW